MKKGFGIFILIALITWLIGPFAYANISADDIGFLQKLLDYVKGLFDKGNEASLLANVAGGVLILISTMKVSFIKPLWDKLNDGAKGWLGPVLGLVAGLAGMLMNGQFSWSVLLAAAAGGTLTPYLHDMLDLIKKIPGLGSLWVSIIEIIEKVLFAPKEQPPQV